MSKKHKRIRARIGLRLQGMTDLLSRLHLNNDSYDELVMLNAEVNQAWSEVQEVLDNDAMTHELCMAWAEMLKRWHTDSFALVLETEGDASFLSYARGTDYLHADLERLLPEGMNEGSKCWPPDDPECE